MGKKDSIHFLPLELDDDLDSFESNYDLENLVDVDLNGKNLIVGSLFEGNVLLYGEIQARINEVRDSYIYAGFSGSDSLVDFGEFFLAKNLYNSLLVLNGAGGTVANFYDVYGSQITLRNLYGIVDGCFQNSELTLIESICRFDDCYVSGSRFYMHNGSCLAVNNLENFKRNFISVVGETGTLVLDGKRYELRKGESYLLNGIEVRKVDISS